jgi:hypothetical protein
LSGRANCGKLGAKYPDNFPLDKLANWSFVNKVASSLKNKVTCVPQFLAVDLQMALGFLVGLDQRQ